MPSASPITFGQTLSNSILTGGSALSSEGIVSTFAGNGNAGFSDGNVSTAQFNGPTGVVLDSSGIIYVADQLNHRVRKITLAGTVTTLAGDGYWGSADGPGSTARFKYPSTLALDNSGNIYVADSINNRIRKISSSGQVTTLAGTNEGALADGAGTTQARFWQPNGVAVDSSGNVYVGDSYNNRLRLVNRFGYVTTLAGSGPFGHYSAVKFADGNGNVAKFWDPSGVAVDSSANVYIADKANHRIRKYKSGVVSTLAGSGEPGFIDGTGLAAQFGRPEGLAVDAAGNVYVAEFRKIRKITPSGVVTTIAGGEVNGFRDGFGTNALFDEPFGIAVGNSGDIYVADYNNHRIRKITFSIPGSWSWTSPTLIPNAGTHSLSVTFTPNDNINFSPVVSQVSVIVSKAVPTILSSPTASSIIDGQNLLSSTLTGGLATVAGSFSFTTPSTTPSTGNSSHSVTFTPADSANYSTAITTVSVTVKATPVITNRPTASAITFGQALSNSVLSGGSNALAGTWSWVTPSNRPNAGTAIQSIRFTPTAANNYSTVTTNVSLVVNKATPSLTWASLAPIPVGTALGPAQLRATSAVAGTYTYNRAVGTVLPIGTHSLVVTFRPTDTNSYLSPVVRTNLLTVTKATPVITWSNPAAITYGTALSAAQLRATSSVTGAFAYDPPIGRLLNAGTNTLRVVFATTNPNFISPVTNTVSLVVNKANPVITRAPTSSVITFGQSLASSTLSNGLANVAGTFGWVTPTNKPARGTNLQSVRFTPTASNNYNSVITNISVRVN